MYSIISKLEQFTADAAADEQRAGKLLQQCSARDAWSHLCALKIVTKDRAHASRRITKRPWAADSYMSSITDKLVLGIARA